MSGSWQLEIIIGHFPHSGQTLGQSDRLSETIELDLSVEGSLADAEPVGGLAPIAARLPQGGFDEGSFGSLQITSFFTLEWTVTCFLGKSFITSRQFRTRFAGMVVDPRKLTFI